MASAAPASLKHGLGPVASRESRLIILGSLPGDASLAAGRYYAHPANQFWRLVGEVIERDLAAMDYERRLAELGRARIGLWDVIGSAERRGSLDQAIRSSAANPLAEWLRGFPDLGAIAFNGKAAAAGGRRALAGIAGPALIDLPSSSPANTLPLGVKAAAWARLREFL